MLTRSVAQRAAPTGFGFAVPDSPWLPAAMYAVGLVAVLFHEAPKHAGFGGAPVAAPAAEVRE